MKLLYTLLFFGMTISIYATFPQVIEYDKLELQKRGESTFKYYGFKVYTIALYTEKKVDNFGDLLSDKVRVLKISYHRNLKKSDFIKNATYILKKNPSLDLKNCVEERDQLHSYYQNVGKGDTYTLSYIPKRGTRLYLNNKQQGNTVKGFDFKKQYFSIWLSENHSVSKRLTKTISGL